MDNLVQQLINGISLGSIYALIALGYTMVYGVIKLINFAHGEIYMVGAYVGYTLIQRCRLGLIPGYSDFHGVLCHFRCSDRKSGIQTIARGNEGSDIDYCYRGILFIAKCHDLYYGA